MVQDAYLRAWRAIGKFRGEAQFSTWMYRITANAAATHMRKRQRHRDRTARRGRSNPPTRASEHAARSRGRVGRLARIASRVALDELPPKLRVARRVEGRVRPAARGDRRGARHLACRRPRCACTAPAASCATCCTKKEPKLMRCDEVAALLPESGRRRRRDEPRGRAPRRDVPALPGRARALPQARPHPRAAADPLRRADAGPARRDARRARRRRRAGRAHAATSPAAASRTPARGCGTAAIAAGTRGPDHRPLAPARRRVDHASRRASSAHVVADRGQLGEDGHVPVLGPEPALGTRHVVGDPPAVAQSAHFRSAHLCQTTTGA